MQWHTADKQGAYIRGTGSAQGHTRGTQMTHSQTGGIRVAFDRDARYGASSGSCMHRGTAMCTAMRTETWSWICRGVRPIIRSAEDVGMCTKTWVVMYPVTVHCEMQDAVCCQAHRRYTGAPEQTQELQLCA